MSLKPLIAHSGHSHQKSIPPKNSQPKAQETQSNSNSDRPETEITTPESISTPKPQHLKAPPAESETSTIKETGVSSQLETATLVTGFGESIFVLLIASPFLLLGLKKRLHK
jgi:hypothetical protein